MYTVAPVARWVLPTVINDSATFCADPYRGHFERAVVRIASNQLSTARQVRTFRRFSSGSTVDPKRWIAFGA